MLESSRRVERAIFRRNILTDIEKFTDSFAEENNISTELAEKLTTWLTTEGVLDFPVIAETYEGVRE